MSSSLTLTLVMTWEGVPITFKFKVSFGGGLEGIGRKEGGAP
jgi:hypothetical protein